MDQDEKIKVTFRESIYILDRSLQDDDPCEDCELSCIEDSSDIRFEEFKEAKQLSLSGDCKDDMVWRRIETKQYKRKKSKWLK